MITGIVGVWQGALWVPSDVTLCDQYVFCWLCIPTILIKTTNFIDCEASSLACMLVCFNGSGSFLFKQDCLDVLHAEQHGWHLAGVGKPCLGILILTWFNSWNFCLQLWLYLNVTTKNWCGPVTLLQCWQRADIIHLAQRCVPPFAGLFPSLQSRAVTKLIITN